MYNINGMIRLPTFYYGVLLGILGVLAFSYFCANASDGGSALTTKMEDTNDIYSQNNAKTIIDDAGAS